jgi:hypothetical protein
MIIRKEQYSVLTQSAETGYIESAVAHLKRYDPLLAAGAGQQGLEKVARKGLTDARRYGLSEGRALQLYLELIMSLGSGFDTDPQLCWLHPYLEGIEGVSTLERARLLQFHAVSYLDRAYGEKGEHGKAALERVGQIQTEQLRDMGMDLDAGAMQVLHWLHPERMDYVDLDALHALMNSARREAGELRLPMPEGAVLLILLMFAFGHKVCADPLHPWLEQELRESTGEDGSARMERLMTRTRTYLKMMLRQQLTEARG